jgi:hypothetical protein
VRIVGRLRVQLGLHRALRTRSNVTAWPRISVR